MHKCVQEEDSELDSHEYFTYKDICIELCKVCELTAQRVPN